jgi:serine/threonine protein kinase
MFNYLCTTKNITMSLFSRSWRPLFSRAWKPLVFPREGFVAIPADHKLRAFVQDKLNKPCLRKELDRSTIYLSCEVGTLKEFSALVLCNFGLAVRLDDGTEHREDIQPNVYRAPEIILDIPWTYSVDIWNVGCMVSVNSFDKRLLTDPSLRRSRTPSKGSTYSLATIQNSRLTAAGPILLI